MTICSPLLPQARLRHSIGGRCAEAATYVRAYPSDLPSYRNSARAPGRPCWSRRVEPILWSSPPTAPCLNARYSIAGMRFS